MDLDTPRDASAQPTDEMERAIESDFTKKFYELTRWDTVGECVGGSGIAMAIYALLLASFCLVYFGGNLLVMLIAWVPLIVIGFLIGAISAIAVIAILYPLNVTVGYPLGSLAFNFVVAGLAGFLPFVPLLIDSEPSDLDLFIAAGPFSAMFLCHVTSYWLTRWTIDAHNKRVAVSPHQAEGKIFWATNFTIKHLMIFTIWVAGGFAIFSFLPDRILWRLALVYFSSQIPAAALSAAFLWLLYRFKRKTKPRAVSSA